MKERQKKRIGIRAAALVICLSSFPAVMMTGAAAEKETPQSVAETDAAGEITVTTYVLQAGDYVTAEYPVLSGTGEFEQSVIDEVNAYFYEEAQQTVTAAAADMEEIAKEIQEYNPDMLQYLCSEVTCGSVFLGGELFSAEQASYQYTGGAHGYGYSFGTTYNLRTGEQLTTPGAILGCDENLAWEAIVEAYRKNIIGQVENITEDDIRGSFDIMEYWMTGEGLRVSIPAYGIASYAAGPQNALVTPEILESVANGTTGDGAADDETMIDIISWRQECPFGYDNGQCPWQNDCENWQNGCANWQSGCGNWHSGHGRHQNGCGRW